MTVAFKPVPAGPETERRLVELVGATKEEQARNHILTQAPRSFRLAQIADALRDISQATIRNALDGLKAEGRLHVGRGRSASWTRTDEPARDARPSG